MAALMGSADGCDSMGLGDGEIRHMRKERSRRVQSCARAHGTRTLWSRLVCLLAAGGVNPHRKSATIRREPRIHTFPTDQCILTCASLRRWVAAVGLVVAVVAQLRRVMEAPTGRWMSWDPLVVRRVYGHGWMAALD